MAKSKTPGKKPVEKREDDDAEESEREDGDNEDKDGDKDEDAEAENRRINAIVTSRVKREMKGVLAQLQTLTEAISKAQTPAKKDEDEEDDDTEDRKESKQDPKLTRKMTKLERELAEEREARKKAEQSQKEEAEKAKRQEMLNIFDSALTEHGVTDAKLRRAALMSLEADGVMVRDEETGKIKFKGQDKYQMETLYDPKVGIKNWVLTEGKSFIPATESSGSGTGASRQGTGNSQLTRGEFGKLSPQQKAAIELERASMGLPPIE